MAGSDWRYFRFPNLALSNERHAAGLQGGRCQRGLRRLCPHRRLRALRGRKRQGRHRCHEAPVSAGCQPRHRCDKDTIATSVWAHDTANAAAPSGRLERRHNAGGDGPAGRRRHPLHHIAAGVVATGVCEPGGGANAAYVGDRLLEFGWTHMPIKITYNQSSL